MELFLIGFNGLLLIAVWTFMLKKSFLDNRRDSLFDLRDQLREKFYDNGWSMDSAIYRRLRDQINAYLRFTETYSFGEFVFMEAQLKSKPELLTALKERSALQFSDCTEAQKSFIADFRHDAVREMMTYMIISSGPLMALIILMSPIAALHGLISFFFKLVKAGRQSVSDKFIELREVMISFHRLMDALRNHPATLVRICVFFLASKLIFEEFVEEYSYDNAKHEKHEKHEKHCRC